MSLAPGARLGVHEILAKLGEGGMGEVYRARDTRLGRDVAIKVLPEAFAADPERLARFEREAKTLASINHSNIAALYGIESHSTSSGQANALVMELVDGEDLSAIIARGSIPLADALPIARQIIDALEAAHDQGIIHRDLKPQNIKVRADGTVKVLDFGLAKATDPAAASGANPSNSPTLTARATQMGMIIGTAAYMAPEQARGRAVDRRADIWAFGVVLYEMLTGRRAFEGEDISTTLAGVLKEDVSWAALPADLSPSIRRLLRRCLEKDPRRRLSAIGDARLELDDAEAPAPETPAIPASPGNRRTWLLATLALTTLWLITLYPASLYFLDAPTPPRILFDVKTPETVSQVATSSLALSPDGLHLAYAGQPSPAAQQVLWVRPFNSTEAQAVPGTDGVTHIFWSPDSRSIAFAAQGELRTMELAGGSPRAICPVTLFGGGTWNRDGVIVFSITGTDAKTAGLFRVPATGGEPVQIRSPSAMEGASLLHPVFLPDGRRFLFLKLAREQQKRAIYAGSLDDSEPTLVMPVESNAAYSSGNLLYHRGGALMQQPFDVDALRVTGEAVRIAPDVQNLLATGRAAFTVSDTGTVAYRAPLGDVTADLAWFTRDGSPAGKAGEPGPYNQLRLSPDGRRAVVSRRALKGASTDLWVLDLETNITSQITFDGTGNNDPVWSPGSDAVMFESIKGGKRDFYIHTIGTRDAVLAVATADDPKWLDDWSSDGKFAIFHLPAPSKVFAVPLDGDAAKRTPRLLAESQASVDGAHFSPDGKWVAYETNESGQFEVWVNAFPEFNRRQQVSARGGGSARWRRDGLELFYVTATGELMSVGIAPPTGPNGTLQFRAPRRLFQSPLSRPNLTIDQYAVTADGQKFLFIAPVASDFSAFTPITVILNALTGK